MIFRNNCKSCKQWGIGLCLASSLVTLGCSSLLSPELMTASVSVSFDAARQEIDGFGASNAWGNGDGISGDLLELLYDRENGIGLTILRNRIPFREYHVYNDAGNVYDDDFVKRNDDKNYIYAENGDVKIFSLNWGCWELNGTRTLIAKIKKLSNPPENLVILSTPWTPPNNSVTKWKISAGTNKIDYEKTPDVGGVLDPEHYADYADLLADYALNFEEKMGQALSVLSIQNEPTWCPNYESCYWTGENIRDFLKILGARFALKNVPDSVRILAAEDENFKEDLIVPALKDPAAAAVIDIAGVHQYYGENNPPENLSAKKLPVVASSGKHLWQTEISSLGRGDDGSIDDGLFWARMIHYDMTIAETNAFLYWWLAGDGTTTAALANKNATRSNQNKRVYTMGQFSRFVRPGWHRIEATANPRSDIYVSAYKSPEDTAAAVVILNTGAADIELDIGISGSRIIGSVELYRTSAAENLVKVPGSILASGSDSVRIMVPAQSVSTLSALMK